MAVTENMSESASIVLQIHDEIVVEILDNSLLKPIVEIMERCMMDVPSLQGSCIDFPVRFKVGKTLGSMRPLDEHLADIHIENPCIFELPHLFENHFDDSLLDLGIDASSNSVCASEIESKNHDPVLFTNRFLMGFGAAAGSKQAALNEENYETEHMKTDEDSQPSTHYFSKSVGDLDSIVSRFRSRRTFHN
jgi:hypothetical protein